ncbi:cytochrome P450 [Halenospora varia]|nr:cytochrome P450 [Halenospora varia]
MSIQDQGLLPRPLFDNLVELAMILFLNAWLMLFACTCSAVFFKVLTGTFALSSILLLLAVEFLSLIVWGAYWIILYPNYFTPFRHLPTPLKRSFLTGNRDVVFPDYPYEDIRRVSETLPNNGLIRFYEPLNREVLLFTKPQAMKEMLSLKPYDFGHPSLIKFIMQRLTGSNNLKLFRKNLRPAFTTTHIKGLTPMFWDKAEEMVQLMEAELQIDSHSVVNLHDYGSRATLDNVGLAMMGHDFDTLQQPDNKLREAFKNMSVEPTKAFNWIGLINRVLDLRPIFKLVALLPLKKSRVKVSSEYIRSVATSVIQERTQTLQKSGSPETRDITTIALETGAFPLDELVDHVMLFLTAGQKSTATAFEWTMYELGRRPEMQRRLRAEIVESLGPASVGTAELGSRVQDLPYLNAVCSEVIRCYPFIPLATKVADTNTTVLGENIPKGTIIYFAPEAFNQDKELWGGDAHIFNPDRWMKPGMANSGGASSNYAMLSFSAGPWGCIGQNFARAMLACLVAAVVRRFEIDLVDVETAGRIKCGPFKRPVEGIHARLKVVESSYVK